MAKNNGNIYTVQFTEEEMNKFDNLRAENAVLRARVEQLETALRPFAEAGGSFESGFETDLEYMETDGHYYSLFKGFTDEPLTVADLTNAATVLNPEPQS